MGQQRIPLANIKILPELQPRAYLDTERVGQYAAAIVAGAKFPPIVCWTDGRSIWLSQGFHRTAAYAAAGVAEIDADVRVGTLKDAKWDAAGSNQEHDESGRYRSNADKRRAVEIALSVRPKCSDHELAEHCGVDQKTVWKYRQELEVTKEIPKSPDRTGRDGRTINTSNIGKARQQSESQQPDNAMPGWLSDRFDELYNAFVRRFFSEATPERFLCGAEAYVRSKER